MDFDEARRAKWEAGRAEYGGTVWAGKPPLEELADEMLDAANYAEEALVRGEIDEDECTAFVRTAHEMWMGVQTILSREEESWDQIFYQSRLVSCGG